MPLSVCDIYFAYPNATQAIFEGFSADFPAGAITAVIGPNGCGKTTLAKIMLNILQPQKGRILLDGEDISSMTLAEVGRNIGYVMQNPNQQLFCVSVKEEVEYGLAQLNLSHEEIESRGAKYLKYFNIDQYRDELPWRLSHGEKQRLLLAAVLAMQPKYLLLDEPTTALDTSRKKMLGEYLKSICTDMSGGMIIISHDESFINAVCHNVVVLEGKT